MVLLIRAPLARGWFYRPAGERRTRRPLPGRAIGAPSLERLAREELRKLQAALHDLGECRKLLAAALSPQS